MYDGGNRERSDSNNNSRASREVRSEQIKIITPQDILAKSTS